MSSISSATANQQTYFPPVQPTTKTDPTNTTTAPAANLQTQQAGSTPGVKAIVESLSFKNSDGTYGPKHTLRSPTTVTPAANESSEAVTSVNVKV